MDEVFVHSCCPNCGVAFSPDFSYGNLRRCKACKQWSIDQNGTVNEKVIFKIIPFELSENDLKSEIVKLLYNEIDPKYLRGMTSVGITKYTFPVREIGTGENRKIICCNQECIPDLDSIFSNDNGKDKKNNGKSSGNSSEMNTDEIPFIPCSKYDKVLLFDRQKQFSEKIVSDKDIKPLEIDISKEEVDAAFHLFRDDFYKIIYLPIYRIVVNGTPLTFSCIGLPGAFGLKERIPSQYLLRNLSDKRENTMTCTAFVCALLMFFIDIPGCRESTTGDSIFKFLMWIVIGWIGGLVLGAILSKLSRVLEAHAIKKKVFRS